MIYVAIDIEGGRATVDSVTAKRDPLAPPEERESRRIFEVPNEAIPGLLMARDTDGPIIDWLIDGGVIGADLVQARRHIADKIKAYIARQVGIGPGRELIGAWHASEFGNPPPITAACPACGEVDKLGFKACMAPGGRACCPYIICGRCRYAGPNGTGLNDAIERWNLGDVDPLVLMATRINRKGLDPDPVRDIDDAIIHADGPEWNSIVDYYIEHPRARRDIREFLKAMARRVREMRMRLREATHG